MMVAVGTGAHAAQRRDWERRLILVLTALLGATACSPSLPEPESAGAVLYAHRCTGCHRLYAPGTMKYEMWKMYVERMQGEFVRRGLPPLTESERTTLLDYLKRYGGAS